VAFETVIGLEIHTQLQTDTKIFCGCKSKFGEEPNTRGCPVCLGLPGSLPVLNRRVVEMAILAGIAFNCEIAEKSIFARKNYFYPDLPKGFQISQYDQPVCEKGSVSIAVNGTDKEIGITRIHIEEDPGKLIHDLDVDSLLDINRCGTPLIEIVTEPDIRSPKEAYSFLVVLKQILEYLGVSDCNMEEGSLRCDANVSLRSVGETKLGTKTEVKNMNSFRNVEKALEYEILRQKDILDSNQRIVQETLLWDAEKNVTQSMRTKEDAHDYRYFPEPDLVPLVVEDSWIQSIRETMPELPKGRCDRFVKEYSLSSEHARVLTDSRPVADYFEEACSYCKDIKLTANWVMSEVLRISKEKKEEVSQLALTPKRLGNVLTSVKDGTISTNAAKKVINRMEEENKEPAVLIEEMGLKQISDSSALEEIVKKILDENPAEVERYKSGEKKLTSFFVGQAMRATKGKGNPKEINNILQNMLG
jgi:aspartyl-tRNA(Asn)/glutamyl-tRNA(Gln) amidotransferase subunit B